MNNRKLVYQTVDFSIVSDTFPTEKSRGFFIDHYCFQLLFWKVWGEQRILKNIFLNITLNECM